MNALTNDHHAILTRVRKSLYGLRPTFAPDIELLRDLERRSLVYQGDDDVWRIYNPDSALHKSLGWS